MRFLANENIPLLSIRMLRDAGHDVVAVADALSGATDSVILATATSDDRVVLTFDRDYGELVFGRKQPAPNGVVYFRNLPSSPVEPVRQLLKALALRELQLHQRFTVILGNQIRQRHLP